MGNKLIALLLLIGILIFIGTPASESRPIQHKEFYLDTFYRTFILRHERHYRKNNKIICINSD